MSENIENKGRMPLTAIWIINILLMIGLVVLYMLHFTGEKKPGSSDLQQELSEPGSGPRIAYIDTDLIMEQYEMVPEMIKSFESSTKSKESVIREKQKSFEQRVTEFQQRVQSGAISTEIAQITEQQLMKEQQDLLSLRDELSDQLSREEYEMNLQLFKIVSEFLEEYNRTRQYDLIFNYKQGSNLFIANKVYDITPEVVEMLNQEYRLRKAKK